MSNEESERHLKERMFDIKEILKLHSEGKTSREISTKVRVAESHVVEVLKKGYDVMYKEIASLYGIKPISEKSKEESSLKNEEDIMKKVLKANFLSSIHPGDYSDTFINGTLRCIDEGILTHIMTLHLLPFSSPSHFITKGEYKTEISDVEDRKGDVESGTSIKS